MSKNDELIKRIHVLIQDSENEEIEDIAPTGDKDRADDESETMETGSSEKTARIQKNTSEEELKKHDNKRKDKFRTVFFYLITIGFSIVASLYAIACVVWVWHIVTPIRLHWLDETGICKLQVLISGGAIGSMFVNQIKRFLN